MKLDTVTVLLLQRVVANSDDLRYIIEYFSVGFVPLEILHYHLDLLLLLILTITH